MHAMIVDSRPDRLDLTQIALLEAGIHVTGSGSLAVAECCLRRARVDLLVLDLDLGARRTGEIIALAERRNPRLVTLVLTPDVAAVTDSYTQIFHSVHCVLGADVAPALVARMAQASLAGGTIARVAGARRLVPEPDAAPAPAPQAAPARRAEPTPQTSKVARMPQAAPTALGPQTSPDPQATPAPQAAPAPQAEPARRAGPAGQGAPVPQTSSIPQGVQVSQVPTAAEAGAGAPLFASRRRRFSPHHRLVAQGA
jgi:DNA-binding NarL/FixJ family response regulator